MTDLIFDIDMDTYDDYRKCGCEGKQICDDCWREFIVPAVTLMETMLRETYQYKLLLWTFSGGRGVHLRVFDSCARKLDKAQRQDIIQSIKTQAKAEGFPLILDEGVTINLKGLLRLPFSIHGDTGLVVVPFDPAKVANFRVSEVPRLNKVVSRP